MPLSIDLPPDVLAALQGRAAARGRTAEEEAAAAVAASVDVLLDPPDPPGEDFPGGDWRNDPEAVALVERIRANRNATPPPDPEPGALAEYLRTHEGVDVGMSWQEWRHYWQTRELDDEAECVAGERDEAELNGWDQADAAKEAA